MGARLAFVVVALAAARPAAAQRPPSDAGNAPADLQVVALPMNHSGTLCPRYSGVVCTNPGSQLQWTYVPQGPPMPASAVDIGAGTTRACLAYVGSPGYPARALNGAASPGTGCTMVLHGRVLVAPEFLVLVGAPPGAPGPASTIGDEPQSVCVTYYEDNTGGRWLVGRHSASTRGCLVAVNGRGLAGGSYRVVGGAAQSPVPAGK